MWQRFVIGTALVFGVLIGVAGTIFGYSNLSAVDVKWSVFRIDGIPLWTVAVVPVAIVLVAGTIYHWYNSLYHFTEHMRHRHRVHELEGELAQARAQLDQLLEMPAHAAPSLPAKPSEAEVEAAEADSDSPVVSNGMPKSARKTPTRKRVSLEPAVSAPEPVGVPTNGRPQTEATQEPVQEP